ncbi:MAG TPA: methyltransferase, partial [Roseiarcus sp.]
LRNPSYTGTVITFLGFGVAIGNWISLITLLIFGAVPYIRRIAVEDGAIRTRIRGIPAEDVVIDPIHLVDERLNYLH